MTSKIRSSERIGLRDLTSKQMMCSHLMTLLRSTIDSDRIDPEYLKRLLIEDSEVFQNFAETIQHLLSRRLTVDLAARRFSIDGQVFGHNQLPGS